MTLVPGLAPLPNGLRCPACGSNQLAVRDTRPAPGAIRRRRQCEACGHRFTSLELPIEGVAGLEDLIDLDSRLQLLGGANLALLRAMVVQMQANLRSEAS